jgi:hypothetical protein
MIKNKKWNYYYVLFSAFVVLLVPLILKTQKTSLNIWALLLLIPAMPMFIVGIYGIYKAKSVKQMPAFFRNLWLLSMTTLAIEALAVVILLIMTANNLSNWQISN